MLKSDYDLALCFAKEYVRTQGTVRSVANVYNVSKSTVHRLLNEFMANAEDEDLKLALRVKKLIEKNKSERHLRGGNVIKERFAKMNK